MRSIGKLFSLLATKVLVKNVFTQLLMREIKNMTIKEKLFLQFSFLVFLF